MRDDLYSPLLVGFEPAADDNCAFYSFARGLMLHLFHSVIAPEDIAATYGPRMPSIKVPASDDLRHEAMSRPVDDPSVPWNAEWSPLATGEVHRALGAHVEDGEE